MLITVGGKLAISHCLCDGFCGGNYRHQNKILNLIREAEVRARESKMAMARRAHVFLIQSDYALQLHIVALMDLRFPLSVMVRLWCS